MNHLDHMCRWTVTATPNTGGAVTEITYPYSRPGWLKQPYNSAGGCYGCGLTPEIMNPGEWALCFWCNELRATIECRMRVSLLAV
jgi:hypothetical protein